MLVGVFNCSRWSCGRSSWWRDDDRTLISRNTMEPFRKQASAKITKYLPSLSLDSFVELIARLSQTAYRSKSSPKIRLKRHFLLGLRADMKAKSPSHLILAIIEPPSPATAATTNNNNTQRKSSMKSLCRAGVRWQRCQIIEWLKWL